MQSIAKHVTDVITQKKRGRQFLVKHNNEAHLIVYGNEKRVIIANDRAKRDRNSGVERANRETQTALK